jgi:hypothetical protein
MSAAMTVPQALCCAQDGRCFYCHGEFTGPRSNKKGNAANKDKWTRDHLRAASKGHQRLGNVILACYSCNLAKGNREPTAGELAHAATVQIAAMRIMRIFNGIVPIEWAALPHLTPSIETAEAAE